MGSSGATGERVMVLPNGLPVMQINEFETRYLFGEIFVEQQYLPADLPPLPPRPTVFDAGANIGLFSLYVLGRWPDARVYAFEPAPEVYQALERNLALHARAEPRRLALGRFPGHTVMSYYPGCTMMSGLRADQAYDRSVARSYLVTAAGEPAPGASGMTGARSLADAADELLADRFDPVTVGCEVESVSGMMRQLDVGHIDLLKIDVERYELDVLLGVEEDDWRAIGRVAVEVDDRAGELGAVTSLLRDLGMRCEIRQPAGYRDTCLYLVHAFSR